MEIRECRARVLGLLDVESAAPSRERRMLN